MKLYLSKLCSVVENQGITGITTNLVTNEIGNVNFVMIGNGQYHCLSNGLFSKERTFPRVQPSDGTTSPATAQFHTHVVDENTILIYSIDQADNCVEADFRNLEFRIEQY